MTNQVAGKATTRARKPKEAAPVYAKLTMPSDKWRNILKMMLPTCDIKKPTHYIGCIQFAKIGHDCYFCSTNGYALTAYKLTDVAESPGVPVLLLGAWIKQVLLPILPNALLEVADVTLRETADGWLFEWEGVSLKARTVDVKFPDWKPRVLPDKLPPVTIRLSCALLSTLIGPDTRTKDQNSYATFCLDKDDSPNKPAFISYQDANLQRIILPIRID